MARGLDKRSSTGGRISSILSNAKKSIYKETNTSKSAEDVDPEVLELLGLEDTSDLDYGEYKTLLKEQMLASRMTGTNTSSETAEKLTNEYKRVKANTGKFVINSSNVKQSTYTPRTRSSSRSNSSGGESSGVIALLESSQERNSDQDEKINSILTTVPETLTSITKVLQDVNNVLGISVAVEEDNLEAQKERDLKRERDEEEKARESAPKKLGFSMPKIPTPKIPFMDRIKQFFGNVLMGGLAVGLLNWIQDPKNQESIDNFVDFVVDKAPLILGGLLAVLALPIVPTILSALGVIKSVVFTLAGALAPLAPALLAVGGAVGVAVAVDKFVRPALQDLVGGKGLTESGLQFNFEDIVKLRNKQDQFMVQNGITGESADQQRQRYGDLIGKMKEHKKVNDQLADARKDLKEEMDRRDRLNAKVEKFESEGKPVTPLLRKRIKGVQERIIKNQQRVNELDGKKQALQSEVTQMFGALNISDSDLEKVIRNRGGDVQRYDIEDGKLKPQESTSTVEPQSQAIPSSSQMSGETQVIIPLDHSRTSGAVPDETGGNTFEASRATGADGREREHQDPAARMLKAELAKKGINAKIVRPEDFASYAEYDAYLKKMSDKGVVSVPLHFDAIQEGGGTGFLTRTRAGDSGDSALASPINDVLSDFASENPDLGSYRTDTMGNATVNMGAASPTALVELGEMVRWEEKHGKNFTQSDKFKELIRGVAGGIVEGGNLKPNSDAEVTSKSDVPPPPPVLPPPPGKTVSSRPPGPPGSPSVTVVAAAVPASTNTSGSTRKVSTIPNIGAVDQNNDTVTITKGIYSIIV